MLPGSIRIIFISDKMDRAYFTGPRGGVYYFSSNGNKIYVKDDHLYVHGDDDPEELIIKDTLHNLERYTPYEFLSAKQDMRHYLQRSEDIRRRLKDPNQMNQWHNLRREQLQLKRRLIDTINDEAFATGGYETFHR